MKDFEIFSTGTHTASNGVTKTYTEDDLDHIAEKYNSSNHTAPIVLGHPKSNAPAWGWIERLYRKGQKLLAKPKDLVNEFVDAVKEKKFLKRSASFTPDMLLNHVGFLGAAVPAVKGLSDIEFNSADEFTEFEIDAEILQEEISHSDPSGEQDIEAQQSTDEFQQQAEQNNENLEQKSQSDESFADENQENVPQGSSNGVCHRHPAGASDLRDNPPGEFSEDNSDDKKNFLDNLTSALSTAVADLQEYLSAAKNNVEFQTETDEELKQLQDRMSDLRTKIDIANFELLLNEKVSYGYLTPAMKEKVFSILKYFSNLNYSEIDSQGLTSDIQSMFKELIDSTPKYIEFEEVATAEDEQPKVQDSSFDDFELDPDSEALHSEILTLSEKENITYEEAFSKIVNQKKS